MVLLDTFASTCSDLFKRDYVHDQPWKISVTHAGPSPVLTQLAHVTPSGILVSSSGIKHNFPWGSFETKFSSSSTLAKISAKPKMLPGVIFGGNFERKYGTPKGPKDIMDLSLEFTKETNILSKDSATLLVPHFKLSVDPLSSQWTSKGAIGIGLQSQSVLHIGGELTGSVDFKTLSYSAGLSFAQIADGKTWGASFVGSPYGGQPFGKLTGSVHCKHLNAGSPQLGAEVTHYNKKTEVAFGGLIYLNQPKEGGKTDTVLKLKLTQDAKIAASLTHKISDMITTTVGTQVDAFKTDDVKYGLSFGFTL